MLIRSLDSWFWAWGLWFGAYLKAHARFGTAEDLRDSLRPDLLDLRIAGVSLHISGLGLEALQNIFYLI